MASKLSGRGEIKRIPREGHAPVGGVGFMSYVGRIARKRIPCPARLELVYPDHC